MSSDSLPPDFEATAPLGDSAARPRSGRPRRGTEAARSDALMAAATRVFLRDGYGGASIDKVAAEAGVSTRTIYERFKNKADLLGTVVTRLIEQDADTVLAAEALESLPPRAALTLIGQVICDRARDTASAALFRIIATEAQRFPELAAKMRSSGIARMDDAIAHYLRSQTQRGTLVISDPDRAARVFLQMVIADLHECLLFGSADEMAALDLAAHLALVVDIFLNGAANRGASAAATLPTT